MRHLLQIHCSSGGLKDIDVPVTSRDDVSLHTRLFDEAVAELAM